MLEQKTFLTVIDATPLVSIDLVVRNGRGEVLLGKRVNRPAQGFWFVPGGRIRKNERVADAFRRIAQGELGVTIDKAQAKLLGVFDHLYEDNFHATPNISTHYVVLGFAVELGNEISITPDDQHSELQWWPVDELLRSPSVHENTKAYFRNIGQPAADS